MNRRAVAALLVGTLVVLAGCGGAFGGDDGGPTSPGDADGALPAGVSADGVANSSQLASAHATAITAAGFVAEYEFNATVSTQGSTVTQSTAQTVRAEPDLTGFSVSATRTQTGQTVETDTWGNGSVAVSRSIVGNRTRYTTPPGGVNRTQQFSLATTISSLVPVADYELSDRETVDGTERVILTADAVNAFVGESGLGLAAENVSDLSSRLVVGLDGVVYGLELSFNQSTSQGPASFDIGFEVTETGDRTVQRPAWVTEALANVTIVDLTADVTDGVVGVTHEGGDTVPNGTTVVAQVEGSVYQGTVSEPIEPGETVYVALDREAGELSLVTERSAASSVAGEVSLQLIGPDRSVLLQTTLDATAGTGDGTTEA